MQNNSNTISNELNGATFFGLHEWFKHLVEKIGWIIIYKGVEEHKNTYEIKINNYKRSINSWLKKANQKLEDIDLPTYKKKDIINMKEKIINLLKNVNELLPTENQIISMNGGMENNINDDDSFIINFKYEIMN
jgi:hypothetical protein